EFQPRLTRTASRCSGPDTPMAARTWDGCTLPDEQAAPDETATSSRSNAITAVSDFMPSTANNVAFERRPAMMTACGTIATIGLMFGFIEDPSGDLFARGA